MILNIEQRIECLSGLKSVLLNRGIKLTDHGLYQCSTCGYVPLTVFLCAFSCNMIKHSARIITCFRGRVRGRPELGRSKGT